MVPRWDVNRKRLRPVGVVFTESLGLIPQSESGSEELGQRRGVKSLEARAGIPSKPTWSEPELSGRFSDDLTMYVWWDDRVPELPLELGA